MHKTLILFLLLVNLGCDQIQATRHFITKILIGSPEREIEKTIVDNEPTPTSIPTIQQISPIMKLSTLIIAYSNSPDKFIADKMIELASENKTDFIEADSNLVSNFKLLNHFLVEENAIAITQLLPMYFAFSGQMQHEFGKILGQSFDYFANIIFKEYFLNFNDETCVIASYIPPLEFTSKEEKIDYFNQRVAKILAINTELFVDIPLQDRLKDFKKKCVDAVQLTIYRIGKSI